jgi:hypothetical protein
MPDVRDQAADRELVDRIEALPINAAHREEARLHFVHVEAEIGEMLRSVAALIDGTAALWHEAFARRRPGVLK